MHRATSGSQCRSFPVWDEHAPFNLISLSLIEDNQKKVYMQVYIIENDFQTYHFIFAFHAVVISTNIYNDIIYGSLHISKKNNKPHLTLETLMILLLPQRLTHLLYARTLQLFILCTEFTFKITLRKLDI